LSLSLFIFPVHLSLLLFLLNIIKPCSDGPADFCGLAFHEHYKYMRRWGYTNVVVTVVVVVVAVVGVIVVVVVGIVVVPILRD
jgi:hypothetical protein